MKLFLKNFIIDVGVSEVKSLTFQRSLINLQIKTQKLFFLALSKIYSLLSALIRTHKFDSFPHPSFCLHISLLFPFSPVDSKMCAVWHVFCLKISFWYDLQFTFAYSLHSPPVHSKIFGTFIIEIYTNIRVVCEGMSHMFIHVRCYKDHKHELFVTHPRFAGWDVETFCKREEWAQKIDRKHI